MKRILILTMAVMFCFAATAVFAQPYSDELNNDIYDSGGGTSAPTPNDDNDDGPDINDVINMLLNTNYQKNEDVDFLQYIGSTATWSDISGDESSGTFIAISLTASNSNSLGIYEIPGGSDQLLDGLGPFSGFGFLGTDVFPAVMLDITTDEFGFYLNSLSGDGLMRWDSDPSKNLDGLDHMMVYDLSALAGKTLTIGFNCVQNAAGDLDSIICDSETESYTFQSPYLLAWEDLYGGGDNDYDDMIFLVDRVQPVVPEPATMVLLGSGLLGMAGFRKKRK